jgi:uncharacterized protein
MMSLSRERLWKRRFGLIGTALFLAALFLLDSYRRPADQCTASAYVSAVRAYQMCGRPILKPYCTCRYYPSCSEYSIEAVRIHGIRYGLFLTAERIASCNGSVPLGTWDPAPPAD